MRPNLLVQPAAVQAFLSRMNLQARFLLVIGVASLLFSLVIWGVFNGVAQGVIERIGVRFAEKQVLYDRARTLQPLIREVALARQMADSVQIRQWAKNENDPRLRAAALAEMEKYRRHFQDGSYFLALAGSGHYYFNDARGQYSGKELRYTLEEGKAADAWFFATMRSHEDYHINVDPDSNLGVTKVWINVVLRDGGKALGVLGTGLELGDFISKVADINQPGITNLFVDGSGAVQIYRDVKYIDFSSIAKSADQRRSIDQLLEKPADRVWVRQAIERAGHDPAQVPVGRLHIDGKHYLAGVAALPEVGWYDVTLLDLDVLLPQRDFVEMGLAVGGAVLGILLVLAFTLHRLVLRPVAQLTDAAEQISQGKFVPVMVGSGEVGELASRFNTMTDSIRQAQSRQEQEIDRRNRVIGDAAQLLEVSLEKRVGRRRAQDNLLPLLAHELRSPVAVIGNAAQMLRVLAEGDKPEWLPRIEKIMAAVRQLAHLMDQILAEDRIGLRGSGLERERGDLNRFCGELHGNLAALHGRTIRFEPCDGDVVVNADWQLIKIAISNLVDNAVKYSPPDSEIGLRVSCAGVEGVAVEVSDQGPGVPPELRTRIFEKFVRGHQTQGVQGVGLGLYLVNWIMQLHGGNAEVAADTAANTFRLNLPRG